MPYKPAKPCRFPGCPRLTNELYCAEHQKEMNRRYERYERDPEVKKRYGSSWQKIRKRYAQMHPLCEECYKNGIITPVDEVHHVIPLAEGGTHDETNLISLCHSCHARLHVKRGDRWHNKG